MNLDNKKENKNYDIIVIGGGCAGLTCGIYGARAGVNILVLENGLIGGQLNNSSSIENYPGFEDINGNELSILMRKQAEKSGATIDEFDSVISVELSDNKKLVETESNLYSAKAVIIASGAKPRPLPVKDEEIFRGKGIHYCAICDGAFYKGKRVAVIGGGNSAVEEGLYLSQFAEEVIFIRRKEGFNAEQRLIERIKTKKNITILYHWDLKDIIGREHISGAIIKNTLNNSEQVLPIDGIFCYIGTVPQAEMFKDFITLDENGYIITDENMQTNINGVYAVGDVRKKEYRQITTAIADATIGVLNAVKKI